MNDEGPIGPIDDAMWSDTLAAEVVEAGPPPRLHGYDVWHDLVRHYSFAEIALTAASGVAPPRNAGRAFELALGLLCPITVGEAPTHAAALSRMLGAGPASVVATASSVLAEHAEALVAAHRPWLTWVDDQLGDPPAEFVASCDAERACIVALRELVSPDTCPALFRATPTVLAAALAILHAGGVRGPTNLVAVIVLARLPIVVAEADRHRPGQLHCYPMTVPPFVYEEDT